MGLSWNIGQWFETARDEASRGRASVEYHLLSWRELYDKSILTADRYSSGAGEWVIRSSRDFYRLNVLSRPLYVLPQRLCLFFDCFTREETVTSEGVQLISSDQPIDQVAVDFAALLSVFGRTPIIPIGLRRVDNRPAYEEPHEIYPRQVKDGLVPPPLGINSPEFIDILNGFSNASDSLAQAILGAAKFYHAGLSLLPFDRSVAYTSLVSAIECLAGFHFKDLEVAFKDVQKFHDVDRILKRIDESEGGAAEVDEVRSKLLRAERFLRRKFADFIVEFTPEEMWTVPDEIYDYEGVFPQIAKQDFEGALKLIYDSRSGFLHGGMPFPIYVEFGARRKHPSAMMKELFEIRGKKKYIPPIVWFERVAHLAAIEFMRRNLAPGRQQERVAQMEERAATLKLIRGLPENVRESLRRLAIWTARFLQYAVVNPHAPKREWADCNETVELLKGHGLIGGEGEGLDGSSWLLNREIGEIVGEFVFGVADNPFRGNELLLPKDWGKLSSEES